MEETIFPPSPSWFLPNIIATREDGSVCYGAKNSIVILKSVKNKSPDIQIIPNAHNLRITAVAFNPSVCHETVQNTVASCGDDGFVKLWKIDIASAVMGHKSHWEQTGNIEKVITLDWSTANPHHIISAAENNTIVVWNVLSNTSTKFSFQKLGATVISCCPYNEKIVAVGCKTGQIFVINLVDSGSILFKLRGHDNKIHSLAWCPVPCNVFSSGKFSEECLLASACQDREIFIWRCGTDGKCEVKYQLPTSSFSKKDGFNSKIGNSFSFSTLCWAEPFRIYSSSSFGELFYFDIKSYIKNKDSLDKSNKNKHFNHLKLAHSFHSKGLFAIACTPIDRKLVLCTNFEKKSELKFTIESNNNIVQEIAENDCNDHVEWKIVTTKNSSLLWTAGQDRQLIACEVTSDEIKMIHNYHTLNGFVYCGVVSPHDPNKIAIGVGDGMVRLWNLTEPSGNVQTYWQKIKDRVMSLAWHPTRDGLLAYGTSEGRLGLIDTNSNKPPLTFKPSRPQPIYSISWGPVPRIIESKAEFGLYCVGDNILSFYDPSNISSEPMNLSQVIPFPSKKQTDVCWKPDYSLMAVGSEDGNISLVEPKEFKILQTVLAYKKLIECIAWHPSSVSVDTGLSPYHGYFTSGSTDNECEIRVFNCIQENSEIKVEKVATLKGHKGHIQSVSWSPHMSAHLVSTSVDSSVQIWDVIAQSPIVNFTPIGMPIFSIWSPIHSDFVITGCRSDAMYVWKVSSQTNVLPQSNVKSKKSKKNKGIAMSVVNETSPGVDVVEVKIKNELENLAVAETKVGTKSAKQIKMFSKIWKGDTKEDIKRCYSLLKSENTEIDNLNYSLGFFQGEDSFKELLRVEEEAHKKANNWAEYYELSLWTGNLKTVLDEKIKSGQLNDFLVSIAPSVSPRMWQEACLAYSKCLAEKKFYRKAASYLLVCHKIYEAIRLLLDSKLFPEALCIARSRLPESDSIWRDIVRKYAEWLAGNGSYLKACECYIYLKEYLEVAKICGKKSDVEFLGLAALAARKCSSSDLEILESANALFKCFEENNFELACRICDDHVNLKYLRVLLSVYQTIHQLDSGELTLETDILSHVKQMCDVSDVIFPNSLQHLYHKYTFYRDKRQVLIIIAQELSFAVCSNDIDDVYSHLIKALSTSYRYLPNSLIEIILVYKLCSWLSPNGYSLDSFFALKSDSLNPKIRSLRAFLCAAIVRKLNDHPSKEDILKNLEILKEIKECALEEENYRYFKNLIDVEVFEKKLSMCTTKIKRKAPEEENKTEDLNNLTNGFERKNDTESTSEQLKFNDFTEFNENEEQETREDVIVEEEISQDLETLKRLKMEIKNFESRRVSCPNPFPVYVMMKTLLETLPENDIAKCILENLEKKRHLLD